MMQYQIDTSQPVPPYLQIKQSIILEIMSGRLGDDDQLPSIREMAKILKINPNTVARAYSSLEEEGFLHAFRGSGYRVKAQKVKIDKVKLGILENEFKNFLQKAFEMGFKKKHIEELAIKVLKKE